MHYASTGLWDAVYRVTESDRTEGLGTPPWLFPEPWHEETLTYSKFVIRHMFHWTRDFFAMKLSWLRKSCPWLCGWHVCFWHFPICEPEASEKGRQWCSSPEAILHETPRLGLKWVLEMHYDMFSDGHASIKIFKLFSQDKYPSGTLGELLNFSWYKELVIP